MTISLEQLWRFFDRQGDRPIKFGVRIDAASPQQMIEGRLKIAADLSNDEGDAGWQGLPTVNDGHGVTGLILPDGPEPDPIRVSQSEAPQGRFNDPRWTLALLSFSLALSMILKRHIRSNTKRVRYDYRQYDESWQETH